MFMGIEIGGDIMRDAQFIANGSDTGLSLSDYRNWFARNQRLGTLKSSVVDYCVGKTFDGLKSPNGALYRLCRNDTDLSYDGIRILLRKTDWRGSNFPAVRDDIRFPLQLSKIPEAVIFCLRDTRDIWHPVLDLDAWDFYVLSGKRLSFICDGAAFITLPALLMLGPVLSDFNGLKHAVDRCLEVDA